MESRTLVLCTANPGKIKEILELLPAEWRVLSLAEAGINIDLPETGDTLEANALQKARTAHGLCGLPCIADDSGLEVNTLGGEPGVHSAHFAGPQRDDRKNIQKLLTALNGAEDRTAQFRTVMAWVDGGEEQLFEGLAHGQIIEEERGAGGFGYDPVFLPLGQTRTFAEMGRGEKNRISHRAKAMAGLAAWMTGLHVSDQGQR